VTVVRDRWGVPHIYASDEHDLYVAQGYVTAQDRLWQMLLRRQAARGRLSDWLGADAAPADAVLSRWDFYAQAASFPYDALMDAYALGVNACIKTCPEPPELTFLKRQGRVVQIDPWHAIDSAALLQMFREMQAQQPEVELRADLTRRFGAARVMDLWLEENARPGSTAPIDPAVRRVLQLTGLPGRGDASPGGFESPPSLPAAWYMATLHTEQYNIAGATWPGLQGMMVRQLMAPDAEPQRKLMSHLLSLPPEGWLQVRVHGMLRQWDGDLSGRTRLGSASAAVYEAWIWYLARDVFQDELGPELFVRYWATRFGPAALARLADRPDDSWWDDAATPQREIRNDIMRRAYAEALNDLGRHYGDLHTIWEWDVMHAATFRHPLGGTPPFAWLLDRTIELGGDALFNPAHPDSPLQPYASLFVQPLQISNHGFALAGGQSGNPFSPHYADLLPLWARGQLVPLQDVIRPQDLRNIEGVLVLTP